MKKDETHELKVELSNDFFDLVNKYTKKLTADELFFYIIAFTGAVLKDMAPDQEYIANLINKAINSGIKAYTIARENGGSNNE